jgi:hypothetical protein
MLTKIHNKNTQKNIPQYHIMCFCTMHASFAQCAKPKEIYVNCLNCIGVRRRKSCLKHLKTFLKTFLKSLKDLYLSIFARNFSLRLNFLEGVIYTMMVAIQYLAVLGGAAQLGAVINYSWYT